MSSLIILEKKSQITITIVKISDKGQINICKRESKSIKFSSCGRFSEKEIKIKSKKNTKIPIITYKTAKISQKYHSIKRAFILELVLLKKPSIKFSIGIRYVGITKNPSTRLNYHNSTPEGSKTKIKWIRKVKSNNLKIKMVILEEIDKEINLKNIENFWIKALSSPYLTNIKRSNYSLCITK